MATSPQHDKANDVQVTYQRRLAQIQSDADLSYQGRQTAVAALWGSTAKELDALRNRYYADRAARKAALERELLGMRVGAPTADVVSYRDAIERVSSIEKEDDATALLSSAILGSDTTLARAILAHSFTNQWVGTINAYVEANPSLAAKVEELWHMARRVVLNTDDWLFVLPKPTEIQMWGDADLIARAGA